MEELASSPRSVECSSRKLAEEFRDQANYFENNAKRMRYPEFRRQHLFVGSAVMEAGCKSVIGSRLSDAVGSSAKTIFGCRTKARAIATRCYCPPESCSG